MGEPRSLRHLAGIPVTAVKAVGPARAKELSSFGIETVFDLLTHYPRRYIDRSRQEHIADLRVGDEAGVIAEVRSIESRPIGGGRGRGRRTMVHATVDDGSGRLKVTYFNQPWRAKQLSVGTEAVFFGKVEDFRGTKQLTNPVTDLLGGDQTLRIVPVYPQSEKVRLTSAEMGRMAAEALRRTTFADPVPASIRRPHGLVDRDRAFQLIHQPLEGDDFEVARRRLVFDELLRMQLALLLRKRHLEATTAGIAHVTTGRFVGQFVDQLPFPLTAAQERAIGEIVDDMAGSVPMHRLLQGDVGAGKTLVAVAAMLTAIEGGHQGALMAPTEVLAEQHAIGVRSVLDGIVVSEEGALFDRPIRVELLTNRVPAAERRTITEDLLTGGVDIVIGTHALLSADVAFRSLGVAVVDEQHRFGVEQRAALRDQTVSDAMPDVLVMTATPIPRTAAMTVYGDLDVSVLDELPPGRTPIETHWPKTSDAVEATWDHVRREAAAGRQAYVVCPLVEESSKLEVSSATETWEELQAGELHGLRVGLLHGRVSSAEKEETMRQFRDGRIDVLVATTVIEVGVDVPNATVMVILDADRFGIAQLHQLRGRVGRGQHASHCYLVAPEASDDGAERLAAMCRTTDGFELAEVDLDLRGEGTILGSRQKGRNDLKLASLRRDRAWVDAARAAAFTLVDAPGGLAPDLFDEVRLFLSPEDEEFLLKG